MLGKLQRFLEEIGVVVMPFDERQAGLADTAFQRYGKGQGHPAQLNFGDCAVYAWGEIAGRATAVRRQRFRTDRHYTMLKQARALLAGSRNHGRGRGTTTRVGPSTLYRYLPAARHTAQPA